MVKMIQSHSEMPCHVISLLAYLDAPRRQTQINNNLLWGSWGKFGEWLGMGLDGQCGHASRRWCLSVSRWTLGLCLAWPRISPLHKPPVEPLTASVLALVIVAGTRRFSLLFSSQVCRIVQDHAASCKSMSLHSHSSLAILSHCYLYLASILYPSFLFHYRLGTPAPRPLRSVEEVGSSAAIPSS